MSDTKISALTAGAAANLTGASLIPVTDVAGNTVKYTAAQLKTQIGLPYLSAIASPYLADSAGAQDASSALQSLVNAAITAGRSTLVIAPGTYSIDSRVTITGSSSLTILAAGAKFVLTVNAAFGLEFAGNNANLTIDGLEVVGYGTVPVGVNGGQTCIGTAIQTGTSGTNLVLRNIKCSNAARLLYIDSATVDAWDGVTIINPVLSTALGIYSGTGYGLCVASALRVNIIVPEITNSQRHGLYLSVARDVTVFSPKFKQHRLGLGVAASPMPALEIARSYNVTVIDPQFDACEDNCLSIEPHESNGAAITRNIRIIAPIFRNSVNADVNIGYTDPTLGTTSLLADVWIIDAIIDRVAGAANTAIPIRVLYCKGLRITGLKVRAQNAYTVPFTVIYFSATSAGIAAYTDDVVIEETDFLMSHGGGAGALIGVELSASVCAASSKITVKHRTWSNTGATQKMVAFDGALSNTNIKVIDRRGEQVLTTTRGDASVTLTTNDSDTVRFDTALTANRTVTLPAVDVYAGRRFRVVRTGLGAFTLDVGGLKTIANSTAAFVDVEYDGAAWKLAGYGAL